MNFIYAFNEEDKRYLIMEDFKYITSKIINNEKAYIFENNQGKVSTFSKKEKDRFLFTNKLNF